MATTAGAYSMKGSAASIKLSDASEKFSSKVLGTENIGKSAEDMTVRSCALFLAAQHGRVEALQEIFDDITAKDADLSELGLITDVDGWNCLILAAYHNQSGIIQMLLDAGLEVDAMSRGGATALHKAAKWDCRIVARQLVEAGANVNLQDHSGMTPVMLAAQRGSDPMVHYLVEVAKSDLQIWDKNNHYCYHHCYNTKMKHYLDHHGGKPNNCCG